MSEYFKGFLLGNAAILGNVCVLPLYPGMFVMFANQSTNPRAKRILPLLGVLVLAGVLTVMVALGLVLYLANLVVANILGWVLPIIYTAVLLLGIAMLFNKNPFERFTTTNVPIARNPAATAYLYGVMLGPMTLPCTGPVILTAFTIGGVAGTGRLIDNLLYFLAFGIGFGWPLAVLPLLASPIQRRLTGFLTKHHRAITILSGVLLIGIALLGFKVDVFK